MNSGMLGGVTLERDVPVPMRDGIVLRADVYRPETRRDHPVLLQRNPYDKTWAQGIVFQHPAWYARHGYIVVVQDARGRFASDGEFEPYRNEARDGADTVTWASTLPGSNGQVGTFGFSYAGATQLLAATEQPPGLRCCAPGFTGSDFYDACTYVGGALSHAFLISWVVSTLAPGDAAKRGDRVAAEALLRSATEIPSLYWTQPLRDFPLLKEAGAAPYFFDWLDHDTRDEYWRAISIADRHDRIDVPCLHYGGWYDSFIEGTLANFAGLAERAGDDRSLAQRLVVGPWAHMPWSRVCGVRSFGEEADNRIDELQLRWFDHWLKGEPERLDEAPVSLFVMGENRWRDADAWPPSDVRVEEWFLRSSGRALSLSGDGLLSREGPGDEPPDVYVYLPRPPTPRRAPLRWRGAGARRRRDERVPRGRHVVRRRGSSRCPAARLPRGVLARPAHGDGRMHGARLAPRRHRARRARAPTPSQARRGGAGAARGRPAPASAGAGPAPARILSAHEG